MKYTESSDRRTDMPRETPAGYPQKRRIFPKPAETSSGSGAAPPRAWAGRRAAAALGVGVEVVHGLARGEPGRRGLVGRRGARGGGQALGLEAPAQALDDAQPLQRVGRVRRAAQLQRLRDLRRQLQQTGALIAFDGTPSSSRVFDSELAYF